MTCSWFEEWLGALTGSERCRRDSTYRRLVAGEFLDLCRAGAPTADSFDWTGENEHRISAVDFKRGRIGRAGSVRLELLDIASGLGTFRRR